MPPGVAGHVVHPPLSLRRGSREGRHAPRSSKNKRGGRRHAAKRRGERCPLSHFSVDDSAFPPLLGCLEPTSGRGAVTAWLWVSFASWRLIGVYAVGALPVSEQLVLAPGGLEKALEKARAVCSAATVEDTGAEWGDPWEDDSPAALSPTAAVTPPVAVASERRRAASRPSRPTWLRSPLPRCSFEFFDTWVAPSPSPINGFVPYDEYCSRLRSKVTSTWTSS